MINYMVVIAVIMYIERTVLCKSLMTHNEKLMKSCFFFFFFFEHLKGTDQGTTKTHQKIPLEKKKIMSVCGH